MTTAEQTIQPGDLLKNLHKNLTLMSRGLLFLGEKEFKEQNEYVYLLFCFLTHMAKAFAERTEIASVTVAMYLGDTPMKVRADACIEGMKNASNEEIHKHLLAFFKESEMQ